MGTPGQQPLNPASLDSLASPVDEPHLPQARIHCGLQVRIHHLADFDGSEVVEVNDTKSHRDTWAAWNPFRILCSSYLFVTRHFFLGIGGGV